MLAPHAVFAVEATYTLTFVDNVLLITVFDKSRDERKARENSWRNESTDMHSTCATHLAPDGGWVRRGRGVE